MYTKDEPLSEPLKDTENSLQLTIYQLNIEKNYYEIRDDNIKYTELRTIKNFTSEASKY